jgi:hypothetical protein
MRAFGKTDTYEKTWLLEEPNNMETSRDEEKKTAFYYALTSFQAKYKYYVSGHYPLSCLYLKTPSCLFFRIQCFRDWILSLSSGKTYSVGPNP